MNRDIEAWHNARTLDDLGQLTADWLEGRNTFLPAYYGTRPDRETHEILPHLLRANKNGYVTTDSQPGRDYDHGYAQRASVIGFTTQTIAQRIHDACRDTGLFALVTPPGADYENNIVVTLDEDRAFSWAGFILDHDNIDHHYAQPCPNAIDALKTAWQVTVIDTEWGCRELLWERLDAAWS